MHSSNLHPSQIDQFHHIARLGVYALLTLSVIAMTVSLNRPGTSVGNSGARAAGVPVCNPACTGDKSCRSVVSKPKCLTPDEVRNLELCLNYIPDQSGITESKCTSKRRFHKTDPATCTENNTADATDLSCIIVCDLYDMTKCGTKISDIEDTTPHCKWNPGGGADKKGACVNKDTPVSNPPAVDPPAAPPAGGACRSQSCCPSQTTYKDGTVMGQEQCMGLGLLNVSWEPSTSTCYGCQSNIQREDCSVSYSYDSTLKMLLIQGYQDAPSVHATRSDWDNGSARVIIDGVMYYPQRTGRKGGNDIYLYGVKVSGEVKQRKVTFQLVHNTKFNTFTCNSETLSLPSPEGPTGPQGNGGGAGDTSGGTNLSDYKAEYSNGNVIFSFKGTDEPVAQVMIGGTDFGDIKSGTRSVLVTESNRSLICGNVNWYVQTKKADSSIAGRSDTITSTVTCPSTPQSSGGAACVSMSVAPTNPKIDDSITAVLTINNSNGSTTENRFYIYDTWPATNQNWISGYTKTTSGIVSTYTKVFQLKDVFEVNNVRSITTWHINGKEGDVNMRNCTTSFTINSTPTCDEKTCTNNGSIKYYAKSDASATTGDKFNESTCNTANKITDLTAYCAPATCTKVTCPNNKSKSYFDSSKDSLNYSDPACQTRMTITPLAFCNDGAVFNPGVDGDPNRGAGTGAITIPKKLIIRSHFVVSGSSYRPENKYAFGVTDPTTNANHYCLKTAAGTFTKEGTSTDLMCSFERTKKDGKDDGADFVVSYAINGEATIRQWLTGYGYLWGTSISDATQGVAYVAGRGGLRDVPLGGINYNVYHNGQAYEEIHVSVFLLP